MIVPTTKRKRNSLLFLKKHTFPSLYFYVVEYFLEKKKIVFIYRN